MGIPPIRIDYPLPHLQSLPHHPRGAYLGAREPSQRALSNRISSQPKVIRHPRRGGGWGWSPGKRGKGGGHRAGSEKREQRERETERRNKRQKDQEGGSERNAGRDESRQRIRLNFFACDVRPLLFSTLPSARNSIFVSARVYTRFSDNLPRQWEDTLHRAPPVYIPIATVYPPISGRRWKRAFVLRAEFVHRPSSELERACAPSSVACSTTTEEDEDEVACN